MGTNSGMISLTGGTFDNFGHILTNSGTINGYGTIRTAGLTNSTNKLLSVGEGNMDVFGNFTNNGIVNIQTGRSAYFYGTVNGNGSFTGGGTAVFLNSLSPGNSPASVKIAGGATLVGGTSLQYGTRQYVTRPRVRPAPSQRCAFDWWHPHGISLLTASRPLLATPSICSIGER